MARVARVTTSPAPVGGWNARDSLASMKSNDAVILTNILPRTTECQLRLGSVDHATGISGTVETLAVYNKADGTNQMFGAAGTSIYNVTSPGAVGAAVVTGQTNSRWQTQNFATTGGKFMYMVNGADAPLLYDGTTWTPITAVSTPAITGVTASKFVHLNVYQRRLWFVEKDSLSIWYLAVDSIAGAATKFDLSSIFGSGGYLVAMGTWTIDSGNGMDDHAVFITSEGEIAVYQGIDPSSADTWSLVGVYQVGAPVGRRCFTQYASDMLIISKDGVLPMSKALASSRVTTNISITDKIQQAVSEATSTYGSNFGWEITIYPEENLLLLNVPIQGATQQYVMYTISGAWCNFTGWNASTFVRMGNSLYFGAAGKVVRAWTGTADSGVNINAEALTSYQYYGGMGLKRFTLARPIISSDTTAVGVLLGLNLDFDQSPPTGSPSFSPITVGLWDSALWDAGVWGGGLTIQKNWQTIGGVGYCAALHMKIASNSAQLRWQSVDYIYEMGTGFV